MTVRRKRWSVVFIAAMVSSLLVGTTGSAGGDTPVVADYGRLDLVLDEGGDAFEFTAAGDATPSGVETLSAGNQCKLSQSGTDLVDISVTGEPGQGGNLPHAGLKDHVIGVRAKGEGTGTPCVRIDGSVAANGANAQTLTIELGSYFGPDQLASYAQVGLKFKFGAEATVEAFNTLGGTPSVPVDVDQQACAGSDCGPDSGSDRLLLAVGDPETTSVLFDKIVISIVAPADGAVSLLDDPAAGFDSYFQISQEFDGVLGCGDDASASDGGVSGTVIRVGDPEVEPNCEEIKPYNFQADNGAKQIAFLPQGSPGATYVTRLEFGIAHDPGSPLTVEYDPLGGTAFRSFVSCDLVSGSLPPTVSTALASLGFDVTLLAGKNLVVPAGETWCEVGRTSYAVGDGDVEDVVWGFGNDDPRFFGS